MMIGDQAIATLDSRAPGPAGAGPVLAVDGADGAGPSGLKRSTSTRPDGEAGRDRRHRRHLRQWPEGVHGSTGRPARHGRPATIMVKGEPYRCDARANRARLHVRFIPEEPLRNACAPQDDGGREHGLPHLRRRTARAEPVSGSAWPCHPRAAGRAGRPVQGQDGLARLADPGAFGRQRAARRAGARTDRRGRPADRRPTPASASTSPPSPKSGHAS